MDAKTWTTLSEREKTKLQDLSGLTKQLIGLENYRVEVLTDYNETRRFIVGRSTGWIPCHIEIKTRHFSGGVGAHESYKTVKILYLAR